MRNLMKLVMGGVALSAMVLGIGSAEARNKSDKIKDDPIVTARNKSDTIKPDPTTAADIETGQMLDKGPRWPNNQKVEVAKDDPCKRPGTQCDPRDGGASSARNKSDTIKPDPPSTAKPKGKGPKGDGSHGNVTPQR